MPTFTAALMTVLAATQQVPPATTAPATTALPAQKTPAPAVPLAPVVPPTPDYPEAILTPAAATNYQTANRPVEEPITMIVIHDIEGTAISTVHWFQNPKAQVTSHYIIGGDGTIYQSVKEHDVAWHAGNRVINHNSVGIEHEGYAYRPGFYNPAEYEASARLVRAISARYNIPRDRTHIIGHFEVPDNVHPGRFGGSSGHTDPGPWWDWDSYMTLVRNDARLGTVSLPTVLHPGETVTASVTLTNTGDDFWPSPSGTTGADQASLASAAISQRALGLVYLGAYSAQTAPLPPASALFGTGWISPRFAAPVASDILPGADATFSLPLHGSRTLGPVTAQFRLYRLPIAPRMPVAFGPTVSAALAIVPWEIVVDASAPGDAFAAPGWIRKGSGEAGTAPIFYLPGTKLTALSPPAAPAQWKAVLPISGQWDVYVRWTPGAIRTRKAQYAVAGATPLAGGQPGAVAMDQAKGGGAWFKLGRFDNDGKTPIVVTLSPAAPRGSVVVADAVRFVGPFPAPPGSAPPLAPPPVAAGPRP